MIGARSNRTRVARLSARALAPSHAVAPPSSRALAPSSSRARAPSSSRALALSSGRALALSSGRALALSSGRALALSSGRVLAPVMTLALLAFALTPSAGCAPPHSRTPTNVIDLRYRMRPASSSTIDLYRWTGSRTGSVKSRCKMVPTDSEMFAARAERCGGLRAWFWGVARVLVEQANSPRFTPPLRVDGGLRWVDLPSDQCGE
jgi:putative component of membrane protein insertase Oxa1/YidC/SpoIIIJ protein YidD